MSELSMSNSSNQYDYMVNINAASLVQKTSSPVDLTTLPPTSAYEGSAQHQQQQQQYAYPEYTFQPMSLVYPTVYPVARFDQPTAYYDPQRLVQHRPNSPDSVSSRSSPPTPPSTDAKANQQQEQPTAIMRPSTSTSSTSSSSSSNSTSSISMNHPIITSQHADSQSTPSPMINPMVPSSFSNTTTARVKETIARANSVPMEFYQTEFLEYSKETYERKMDAKRNKRKRTSGASSPKDKSTKEDSSRTNNKRIKQQQQQQQILMDSDEDIEDDLDDEMDKMANAQGADSAELRRQIHIQSEQKRRAQIKGGFDELRKHLPGCNNKKMSKAALLTRTVQQLQHMKVMQTELLAEVERLVQENDDLKKFQHGVLQRQAMEKMYNY